MKIKGHTPLGWLGELMGWSFNRLPERSRLEIARKLGLVDQQLHHEVLERCNDLAARNAIVSRATSVAYRASCGAEPPGRTKATQASHESHPAQ